MSAQPEPTPGGRPDLRIAGREHFATSRAADFLQPRELSLSMGVGHELFLHMAVKELIDNAIDAAELGYPDTRPEITITVAADPDANTITVTVADNGPGIPADVVAQVLNFDYLISDKAVYRAPTRGQQGNALKTVVGVGSVLGGHPVVIDAHGWRHTLSAELISNVVEPHYQRDRSAVRVGTRVTVTVNADDQDFSPAELAAQFALANPHVQIEIAADPAVSTRLPTTCRGGLCTRRPRRA